MKKRLFDPKKCPYKQLMKPCNAIVYVSYSRRRGKVDVDKIRVVSKEMVSFMPSSPFPSHVNYDEDFYNEYSYTRSCYTKNFMKGTAGRRPSYDYTQSIKEMKEWDKPENATIIHIDFL